MSGFLRNVRSIQASMNGDKGLLSTDPIVKTSCYSSIEDSNQFFFSGRGSCQSTRPWHFTSIRASITFPYLSFRFSQIGFCWCDNDWQAARVAFTEATIETVLMRFCCVYTCDVCDNSKALLFHLHKRHLPPFQCDFIAFMRITLVPKK